MRVRRPLSLSLLLVAGLLGMPAVSTGAAAADYVVVLHEGSGGTASAGSRTLRQTRIARVHGVTLRQSFRFALDGFAARLTPAQRDRLAAHPQVASVERDHYEQVLDPSAGAVEPTGAMVTAGAAADGTGQFVDDSLSRIGAHTYSPQHRDGIDERVDVDIAILDSGIGPLSDLNIAGGYNCTGTNRQAWGDVYGHGTEVAAIAGALDNDQSIVGVAPGARLWAVKMITNSGGTSISMALCAVDWVTGKRDPADPARPLIEVANMSFTIRAGAGSPVDDGNCGRTSGDPLHRAICRMKEAGTIGVAAAGNHGHRVGKNRPAAFREVFTVSAMADFDGRSGGLGSFDTACLEETDEDDTFANFSNYGRPIDIVAPGACMTMPWIRTGGTLHQQSGTSFAAPLVAGTVALYLERYPGATQRQVRRALLDAATRDWFRRTDPDGDPDMLLNLANLRAPDT